MLKKLNSFLLHEDWKDIPLATLVLSFPVDVQHQTTLPISLAAIVQEVRGGGGEEGERGGGGGGGGRGEGGGGE